jgi:hypothetical protein
MPEEATLIVYVNGKEMAYNLRDYIMEIEKEWVRAGVFSKKLEIHGLRIRSIYSDRAGEKDWGLPDEEVWIGAPFTWRIIRGEAEEVYYAQHKDEMIKEMGVKGEVRTKRRLEASAR